MTIFLGKEKKSFYPILLMSNISKTNMVIQWSLSFNVRMHLTSLLNCSCATNINFQKDAHKIESIWLTTSPQSSYMFHAIASGDTNSSSFQVHLRTTFDKGHKTMTISWSGIIFFLRGSMSLMDSILLHFDIVSTYIAMKPKHFYSITYFSISWNGF